MLGLRNINFTVYAIGFIEVIIGISTMLGLFFSFFFALSKKSPNIFMFVLISALISTYLGFGLLRLKNLARRLLIFFSGWVVLTKLLVFMGILQLHGALLTTISNPVKNTVSVIYHITVIALLNHSTFKDVFRIKE
ncbi:MAG: hypothetical protein A2Z72_08775 [Omnitrophica bacterium RBG_13_46_9]|nr:MAG: hypothetical protein A2Z72_08775 [Omnitrophica bacterium RBG_13_46_9]